MHSEKILVRTRGDAPARAVLKGHNSRERILEVALQEFSAKGLTGARVDDIAELARTSKRMIYYHFGGKEELFLAVIERSYAGIRESEASVDVEPMEPVEALTVVIGLSFDHHQKNEAFVRLAMSENIHYAEHIQAIPSIATANRKIVELLAGILERGVESGVFRPEVDPLQLHMTTSALCFHYMANRYTFSHVFACDMQGAAAVAKRRAVVIETVIGWCLPRR
jgi:AcrR family transcriptional regulator